LEFPINDENPTRDKLTEFSISSMHIKIMIAFLLMRTPITPSEKSIAESKR